MLKKVLEALFTHPLARNIDLNSPETTELHSCIIQDKPFLKQFYQDCYLSISNLLPDEINGPVLELGSGGGFLKIYISNLVTSEILKVSNIDVILDGQQLPFKNASLRAIVMIDVFHHIPDVKSFLTDASRSIKPGGAVIMIEPWVTKWSRFVYTYLHHEPFDPKIKKWMLPKGRPLSNANSALPWIVFERDREKFQDEFPKWQKMSVKLHSPFCYLVSGGVSYRSFMPGRFYRVFRQFEDLLRPFFSSLAMFATIRLHRETSS
jgi:SAM-dependent methyltransferase